MIKKIFKKLFLSLLVVATIFWNSGDVLAIYNISDLISTSAPGFSSDHRIRFRIEENIPPSGYIRITPESGFFIEGDFDSTDLDLATANNVNGPYTDRELSFMSDAINDGIFVSASTTNGNILFWLNSTTGIDAGTFIEIELGLGADYGDVSDKQIKNHPSVGTHEVFIETMDTSNALIESSRALIAIVERVSAGTSIHKSYYNGSPAGWLSYGTTDTIMSLGTNFNAYCRYSDTPGVVYADMTNNFNYVGGPKGIEHTVQLSGLGGGNYVFYIRCEDGSGVSDDQMDCTYNVASGTVDVEYYEESAPCVDYPVVFSVASQPGSTGDDVGDGGDGDDGGGDTDGDGGDDEGTDGDGGTSSGGGGSGGGAGGGVGDDRGDDRATYLPFPPPPGKPGVILKGYAQPSSVVTVLRDGEELGLSSAGVNANFGAFIEETDRGIYTFSLWSKDSDGRQSVTYSTTFWIDEGTQTTVADIIIPPTIQINDKDVLVGESIEIVGQSVPDSKVEVFMLLKNNIKKSDNSMINVSTTVGGLGKYNVVVPTTGLSDGIYIVKVRDYMEEVGYSEYSDVFEINVGAVEEPAEDGECSGADLNGDGRVNIVDFSILLYHWNSDNDCADQNDDGNVNLIDFSIMMYNWTG